MQGECLHQAAPWYPARAHPTPLQVPGSTLVWLPLLSCSGEEILCRALLHEEYDPLQSRLASSGVQADGGPKASGLNEGGKMTCGVGLENKTW